MRWAAYLVCVFVLAGCLSGPPPQDETVAPGARLNPLNAQGATAIDEGANRSFTWSGSLGRGAEVPLVNSGALSQYDKVQYKVPVDGSVRTLTLNLTASQPAVAMLRTDQNRLACVARAGRTCASLVPNAERADWTLTVTSLSPSGTSFKVTATISPLAPPAGDDQVESGGYEVFDAKRSGGEPTLAVLKDGRVVVVANSGVLRMDASGTFTDVTPPIDKSTSQTLDPFLYGDPTNDRVYVTQLASCMRLSWTDNAGSAWTTNPMTCGGPEQHHQKVTTGPGPAGRIVHIATMNLASWLASDDVVIFHSRSLDGGLTFTQNTAMTKQQHGMEARAVGNVATSEAGTVFLVAYLCDKFVEATYNGLGVGRSTDNGVTWTWKKIAPGGGRCEGIDPGLVTVGRNVYAMWEDISAGVGHVWYASSADDGVTWTAPVPVPTPGLGSFAFTDNAASKDRVVATFLATPNTTVGPTQAPGWSYWYPYAASLDLLTPGAEWRVERLQDDPVQIGPICMDGPMCLDGARNLLDFIDVQIGADGRARIAYPDGCNEQCRMPWESRGSTLRVAVERAVP